VANVNQRTYPTIFIILSRDFDDIDSIAAIGVPGTSLRGVAPASASHHRAYKARRDGGQDPATEVGMKVVCTLSNVSNLSEGSADPRLRNPAK